MEVFPYFRKASKRRVNDLGCPARAGAKSALLSWDSEGSGRNAPAILLWAVTGKKGRMGGAGSVVRGSILTRSS